MSMFSNFSNAVTAYFEWSLLPKGDRSHALAQWRDTCIPLFECNDDLPSELIEKLKLPVGANYAHGSRKFSGILDGVLPPRPDAGWTGQP